MDAHVELIVHGKAGADVIPGGVADLRKRQGEIRCSEVPHQGRAGERFDSSPSLQ
jgi:hypothetical protein